MHNNQQDEKIPSKALHDIVAKIENAHKRSPLSLAPPILVAASKGQNAGRLELFLEAGLRAFGENRVQEAASKWPELQARYPDIALHLIGPLQSNKAGEAVALFDVIETIDREKIARAVSKEMEEQKRHPACLVQVNIGKEPQKSGIVPEELGGFLAFCHSEAALPIHGLMCVPPADEPPAPYFALMHELAKRHGLSQLSMGMSADFEAAIKFGATHVRVGTALFGERKG